MRRALGEGKLEAMCTETPGSAVHSFLGSDRALCFPNTKQGWVSVRRRAGRCCNGTRCEGEVLLHPRFPQSGGERMAWLGINFLPDRVLPLSYFAVISFGFVTLHSAQLFSSSREDRTVNVLQQPAAEEPSCWLLASQPAAEGNESSAAGS